MSDEYQPTRKMQGPGGEPEWSQYEPDRQGPQYQPTIQSSQMQGYGPPQAGYPGASTEVLRPTGTMALAWLVIVEGPHTGHIFHLHPSATLIGRDTSCDIVLDDSAVSRQHAKIRVVEEDKQTKFVLHDLATENGTLVNDEEIVRHDLEDGDYIKVGRTELVFKQVLPKKTSGE